MDSQNQNQEHNSAPMLSNSNNKVMAALSYLGPLVFVPFFTSKDDSMVKFHIKQGLVVFCIEVGVWLLGSVLRMYSLWMILSIVNLATLVLSIIGIINVVQGKEKELPIVGGFSKNFNF